MAGQKYAGDGDRGTQTGTVIFSKSLSDDIFGNVKVENFRHFKVCC